MAAWTRRAILQSCALLPLSAASEKRRVFPSERVRYADGATEFVVERLTDPSHSSRLPAPAQRAYARRGNFFLFSSQHTGDWQVFQMDDRTGEATQLTEADALDPASVALLSDDRSFCWFDGLVLRRAGLTNPRPREIYRVAEGWHRGAGFNAANDSSSAVLVETRNGNSRLRLLRLGGSATTLVERSGEISEPMLRPRRDGVLYRYAGELWLTGYRGGRTVRLPLPAGGIGPARWSPDGKTVFYLHFPDEAGKLNALRECNPEEGSDKLIAPTSQFVQFGVNSDGSVFAGASGSKAAPYVLLLLRATRREMTLCEHRASDPAMAAPEFSPDSRRILFQSDRHGKTAIYRMQVERLVEPTEPTDSR